MLTSDPSREREGIDYAIELTLPEVKAVCLWAASLDIEEHDRFPDVFGGVLDGEIDEARVGYHVNPMTDEAWLWRDDVVIDDTVDAFEYMLRELAKRAHNVSSPDFVREWNGMPKLERTPDAYWDDILPPRAANIIGRIGLVNENILV